MEEHGREGLGVVAKGGLDALGAAVEDESIPVDTSTHDLHVMTNE